MPDEELRKIFTENLNKYMELSDHTQADLARRLHVSTATVAKWCTGQTMPRIDKIQAIASWLGIRKSDLLERHSGSEESYYVNRDARDIAEFLHKNPDYKVLFDATRKVRPEDIDFVRQMIERVTRNDG